MDSIQLAALALIQGLTEFLPISSSAHLILPSALLGWRDQGLAFDVAVHVGSLLAVVLYFRATLFELAFGCLQGLRTGAWNASLQQVLLLAVASVPITLVGPFLDDLVETVLRSGLVIAATTIGFGLLLWHADRWAERTPGAGEISAMSWRGALIIGVAQTLALIPGTSRSGITMTAGLYLNLSRTAASRFSFLMSIPTILGAGLFKTKDLLEAPGPVDWMTLAVGAVLSFAAALICITLFLRWIERSGMLPFVIYRLTLGGVLLILLS